MQQRVELNFWIYFLWGEWFIPFLFWSSLFISVNFLSLLKYEFFYSYGFFSPLSPRQKFMLLCSCLKKYSLLPFWLSRWVFLRLCFLVTEWRTYRYLYHTRTKDSQINWLLFVGQTYQSSLLIYFTNCPPKRWRNVHHQILLWSYWRRINFLVIESIRHYNLDHRRKGKHADHYLYNCVS